MNLQDQYVEALLGLGFVEIESSSRKYRTLRGRNGSLYFLGKSGAVRFGKNASSSMALPENIKRSLLRRSQESRATEGT